MVSGARYLVAGLILGAIVLSRGVSMPSRDSWPGHALLGFLMLGVGNGAMVMAERWVPSGMTAVMAATIPFWMIGAEALTSDGDSLSLQLIAGLLVGFSGILLLVWPDVASGDARGHQYLFGIIALQVACIGWAVGSAVSRRHARNENVLSAAAMQMTFGGLFMLAVGTARGEWSHLSFSMRSTVAEIYLILAGSIIGYTAYTYALRHLPTATAGFCHTAATSNAICKVRRPLAQPTRNG